MKKTLIIALASMMLFAFTQCGGGGLTGSKEFKDTKKMYEEIEKIVDDATTCDELEEAALTLLFSGFSESDYTEEDRLTESEEDQLDKILEKIAKKIEKKSEKFNCEEDEE